MKKTEIYLKYFEFFCKAIWRGEFDSFVILSEAKDLH